MLFSRSEILGGEPIFPPFRDITEFVEQIATVTPDPTRIKGSVHWSPVKVACALQVDESDPPGIACPVPGLLGACRQGVPSCAPLPLTCRQTVFPVPEVACNGVDDDCDGRVDEVYNFSGYLPPIKPDGSSVFLKKRGAIPVKFQLTDCAGAFVTGAVATIQVLFHQEGVVGDEEIDVSSLGNANTDNFNRYDPVASQYIYNLNASSLQPNSSYIIRTQLDDGTEHDVLISIR